MIIPLATPRNGELINLLQVVKVRQHRSGRCKECESLNKKETIHALTAQSACTVYFADGGTEIFDGEASRIFNLELHFALNLYRAFQQSTQSQIVTPDGSPPPRIM